MTFDALVTAMQITFGREDLEVTRDTTAAEVPGWDSLSHVWLMLEIEQACGVSIGPEETAELPTVGALYDFVCARCGQ